MAHDVRLSQYYGASHFADNANWEPQRDSHWELIIDLSTLVFPDKLNSSRRSFTPDDSNIIRLAVQSVTLPALSVNPQPIKHGNEQVLIATNPTVGGSVSITCIDSIGYDIQNMLLDWFRIIYNFDGDKLMGLSVNYKTTASLLVFAPDASVMRSWDIYGLFPTNISIPNMGTGGGFTTISCSFSCDRLERKTLSSSDTNS